ncbi:hypothetical protein BGX31_004467 [Mortierella sp. GBA43]|nr:hypothetical protein BGX31_004467 [Mortierella sp. GBA43]
MVFGNIVPSNLSSLSLQQALELTNIYLENAYKTKDHNVSLALCHDAEVALAQAKRANKKYPAHPYDAGFQALRQGISAAYIDLGKFLEAHGFRQEADAICKKSEKWGGRADDPGRLAQASHAASIVQRHNDGFLDKVPAEGSVRLHKQTNDVVLVAAHIFTENVGPPSIQFKLPEADERLNNTHQLIYCLHLLQVAHPEDNILEPNERKWLEVIEKDINEQDRLRTMAVEVIRAFKRDEIKDARAIAEVVCLAPVLDKDSFQDLLREFYSGIDHSGLLNIHQLEGLAQVIHSANPGHLNSDDLVKILGLLSVRLKDTHHQSVQYRHQLTMTVSHVLDAMADSCVTGLDREKLHEPLSNYLGKLKESSDPFLVYQAAYAYQALLCVPDDESIWNAAMRRTGTVIRGVSGIVSAVKGLDLVKLMEGLEDIQKGLGGVSKVVDVVKTAYDGVASLAKNGQGLLDSLKEGLSFERKREWYSALRGIDVLIRDGELATFRKLVCEAPCRRDLAFQWGVCQRLGEMAANPMWDPTTRQSAITFLGEIYKNDAVFGGHPSVQQWVLNILMQLSSSTGSSEGALQFHATAAKTQIQELEECSDRQKQALFDTSREQGPVDYPLKITLPEPAFPSLLDRVQNRPDVESNLRVFRKQRTRERGNNVYIQPQAKASFHAADETQSPLMEKVKEFLKSGQKVFLILGDSGAGKSTFSRELEFELWQSYKNKTGRIPLHINLPAIDKPEHDMIAKQLRKVEFTEPQIREMKHYRKFILICDGYDESQQTHNLYMSNQLNQPGEWDAQMVISCRSEYLGSDYRDRFQPGDRNQYSSSSLFQEAVVTPFTLDQVQDYIQQYVSVRQPLWRAEDYKQALELIPSLKELVKNPFLMALSLEVLPRMVEPGQHLSTTRVTRVTLYDHFVEQWLERGKKRIGERSLTQQVRVAFDRLSDEGFTVNGIAYLKRLAVAIYKEQDGHPVVEYSQLIDEGSWKDSFFGREDKELLREACPLLRNGSQHRFIHKSMLEYGLARAVYDPQDRRNKAIPEHNLRRRGSASSTMSFEMYSCKGKVKANTQHQPDIDSPLTWRSFVSDYSLLQFLEERAQQEPLFKQQLLGYIEHSKKDKKWRTAAANAITILVRAGVQFVGTDLRGIQIPGADLSYGVFDAVQMQDADLRKVNLRSVWMRQADLSRSMMTGVQFCELPYLSVHVAVGSCAYSPDGKFLAVALEDGKINVYTTSDWEKIQTLSGHAMEIQRILYSPKGGIMATGSRDGTIRIWDAGTGECRNIIIGHTDEVNMIAFSFHGDQIASSSDDKTARIWDPETGDSIRTLSGHSEGVLCVAYPPSGDRIATSSIDCTIRLWSTEFGSCSHILLGHTDDIWDIRFSPLGNQLASASTDKTVRLWDAETGLCQHILSEHNYMVYSVVYSPKGDQVVSSCDDQVVRLWDVESGTCQQTLTGHRDAARCAVYSPTGNQLASGSADGTVRLWDVSTGVSRHITGGHNLDVFSVKYSPKEDQFVSSSGDTTIRLWDAETGVCLRTMRGHVGGIRCVAYAPSGSTIVSGSADQSVRLWDVKSGTCRRIFTGHSDWVTCVAYSPKSGLIVSGSYDSTIRLWDATSGECREILYYHEYGIMSVAVSPNGMWIASGSNDFTVRIWSIEATVCHHLLEGHEGWVKCVEFSPQGNQLASAGYDGTIRLWDVETGDCEMILIGHSRTILGVAYSPDGDLLASGGIDKTVRIWDLASGQSRAVITDIQGNIEAIDWRSTSDADYLVLGCDDCSVHKWQLIKGADQLQVRLCWTATNGALMVTGANVQNARGLTQLNKQLLRQRGAVGEPEYLLREAGKKVIAMASAVSKLKQLSVETGSPLPDTGLSDEQAEEPIEQNGH